MSDAAPTPPPASPPASEALIGLVLAGRRAGGDPLEAATGAAHKALIDIAGRPMLARVLNTLASTPAVGEIRVAAPAAFAERFAALVPAAAASRLKFIPAEGGSPAACLAAALAAAPPGARLLATTCDHPLLTPAMIESFLTAIAPATTDAAAACVTRRTYEAAFAGTARTFIRLKGFNCSGANLFWLKKDGAEPLLDFWRMLEANRKNPARMARAVGFGTGLAYLAGRLTKAGALAAIEKRAGARVDLVALPQPEAAIDVDKPADIDLVQKILARRDRA